MVLLVGVSPARLTLTLGGAEITLSLWATPAATVSRQQQETALNMRVEYRSSMMGVVAQFRGMADKVWSLNRIIFNVNAEHFVN